METFLLSQLINSEMTFSKYKLISKYHFLKILIIEILTKFLVFLNLFLF